MKKWQKKKEHPWTRRILFSKAVMKTFISFILLEKSHLVKYKGVKRID
jgi:hypothetical protein